VVRRCLILRRCKLGGERKAVDSLSLTLEKRVDSVRAVRDTFADGLDRTRENSGKEMNSKKDGRALGAHDKDGSIIRTKEKEEKHLNLMSAKKSGKGEPRDERFQGITWYWYGGAEKGGITCRVVRLI